MDDGYFIALVIHESLKGLKPTAQRAHLEDLPVDAFLDVHQSVNGVPPTSKSSVLWQARIVKI